MSLKSLNIFKNNQTGLIWKAFLGQVISKSKNWQRQRHKSFRTLIKFSLNENLKIKGFKITEIRQKSKARKTVILTQLEMSSYQKIE